MSTPFFECQGLCKAIHGPWQHQRILLDLNFQVQQGDTCLILGHNGAGKSTLIKLILGLVHADKGQAYLGGMALTTAQRQYVGYMPESGGLPPDLTPLECLRFHCRLYGCASDRQTLIAQLTRVGLAGHEHKLIGQLSKGLGRRLAFALAVVHQPQLLILDEPFSGLDPVGRADMEGWLSYERSRGATQIICTHELGVLSAVAEQMLILNCGRLSLHVRPPFPETADLLLHLRPRLEATSTP